ncbi:ureidoglycolate lyase [Loktanella sp. DSM 29012]|uniref:ureidoglycolate lyase n=1 Tax=Loktanella sp. DSM 29012 TaxID=1881056 RepID=UPI0008AF10E9|nr:ureidoglycolate lyase [Loktanella sp. DSM 29012]SEQ83589.1 ureidoglycolate lyase [Loktanella sp. DSM 29012]
MPKTLALESLTAEAFAPFGDLMVAKGQPDKIINQGKCGRFHDLGKLDFDGGRAGISLFRGEIESFPISVEMVERHPDGSQAFIPMSETEFLVIVAPDEDGVPGTPRAFLAARGQAINFHRGTWHGVLTPLSVPGLFAVVDRIGTGANLEEHWFDTPYSVEAVTEDAGEGLAQVS